MVTRSIKDIGTLGIVLLLLVLLAWATLYAPFGCSSLAEDRLINFYGRVLDQNDQPVARTSLMAHVCRFCPIPPYFMCVKELRTETDFHGFFQFRFVRGPGSRQSGWDTIGK